MSFATNIQQVTPVVASTTETGTIVEDTATGTPKLSSPASSATANTFGSWAEHDASMAADSWICAISLTAIYASLHTVFELGIGAAGSETTIFRWSFYQKGISDGPEVFILPIPIKIASGTRLAVRIADVQASVKTVFVGVQYYQGLET